MELLSEDDMNLKDMTLAELEAAWDLWFELAQHTDEFDEPYTHGVFQGVQLGTQPVTSPGSASSPGQGDLGSVPPSDRPRERRRD